MKWQEQIEKILKKTRALKLPTLKKLFLLFLSIAVPLLAIEVYLEKTNYPFNKCGSVSSAAEGYIGQFDEETGWSYKPKISFYEKADGYTYHFNEDGIRMIKPNATIDYKKPRIVFIGDSVTFGDESNYEDTFAYKIGQLLENKFEIINLGVQGYGTDQAMLRLRRFAEELDPDYIVYTFIPDNKDRNINYDRRLHVKCLEFPGTKPLFSLKKGNLVQIGRPKKYDELDRFKLPLFINHVWQIFREERAKKTESEIKLTAALTQEIQNIAQEQNAKDYYIYYDTFYDLSEDSWNNYLASNILTEDQLSRTLKYINWAEDSWGKGTKYFVNETDDVHPNATLSAMLAKKFVETFGQDFE